MNRIVTFVGFAMFATSAAARGGRGSVGEAGLLLALLAVLAVAGAGAWLNENYPSLFPTIGGIVLMAILSGWIVQAMEGLGIVSGRGALIAMPIVFVVILFGIPALISRSRRK